MNWPILGFIALLFILGIITNHRLDRIEGKVEVLEAQVELLK